jgi:hypothetical protein
MSAPIVVVSSRGTELPHPQVTGSFEDCRPVTVPLRSPAGGVDHDPGAGEEAPDLLDVGRRLEGCGADAARDLFGEGAVHDLDDGEVEVVGPDARGVLGE